MKKELWFQPILRDSKLLNYTDEDWKKEALDIIDEHKKNKPLKAVDEKIVPLFNINLTKEEKKYQEERCIVSRLLELLGISSPSLINPKVNGYESGLDVLWTSNNKKIGFQVTVYHSDENDSEENSNSSKKGSQLRRRERQIAKPNRPYTMSPNLDPVSSLYCRIIHKIGKAKEYNFSSFDGVILLIASSTPQWAAVASTLLFSPFLDISKLNQATHSLLKKSYYDKAYIFNMMGDGSAIYEWLPTNKWKKLR